MIPEITLRLLVYFIFWTKTLILHIYNFFKEDPYDFGIISVHIKMSLILRPSGSLTFWWADIKHTSDIKLTQRDIIYDSNKYIKHHEPLTYLKKSYT